MAVVGIRSRDQVWQLILSAVALAAVLIAAGYWAVGGQENGNTSAEGVTIADQSLVAKPLAGPSAGNERGALPAVGDTRRSGGPIEDRPIEDQAAALTVTTEAETTAPTTTEPPSTTEKPTTTTVASSTTESTSTTEKPTTSETTTAPTTDTTGPPTTPKTTSTTGPIFTILPPTSEQEHSITPKDLARARKQWRSMGYDSYSMTVFRGCFCPREATGPFAVVVRGGQVESVRPVDDDDGELADWLDPVSLTVPGLFNLIESSFDADGLNVVFDKSTGIPLSIQIDHLRYAVDDEVNVTVSDFLPHRGR